MKVNQATYPVARMCRLLGVSTSGYYAWLKRGPSKRSLEDASLTELISEIHAQSWGAYGAPPLFAAADCCRRPLAPVPAAGR